MLVREGGIRLASYHFDRIFEGLCRLQFQLPASFNPDELAHQVIQLCAANRHDPLSRVRLTVFRGEGGLFEPAPPHPHYVIESAPLTAADIRFSEKGLTIDTYPDGRKACDVLANLKSNNYLLYVLAALYARRHHLDDCLVLNSHDRLADSTIANLFYIKDRQFYTPPLSEGCVAGVMRRHLLTAIPEAGFSMYEKVTTPEDLLDADEIFLTNAIRGIRWVESFRDKRYSSQISAAIYTALFE
jgi:branched-chain amino acid aminotransferase